MDVLNFVEKPNFPLASTWLDKQYQITKQLADSIAKMVMQQPRFANAQAVIYSGCTVNNNVVSTGYIVFNGALYQLKESSAAAYLVLRKQATTVQVGVDTYTPYENWWLELSDSDTGDDVVGSVLWSDVLYYGAHGVWVDGVTYGGSGTTSTTSRARINARGYVEINVTFNFTDDTGLGVGYTGVIFSIINRIKYAPDTEKYLTGWVIDPDNSNKVYPCFARISSNGVITFYYNNLPGVVGKEWSIRFQAEYYLKENT